MVDRQQLALAVATTVRVHRHAGQLNPIGGHFRFPAALPNVGPSRIFLCKVGIAMIFPPRPA